MEHINKNNIQEFYKIGVNFINYYYPHIFTHDQDHNYVIGVAIVRTNKDFDIYKSSLKTFFLQQVKFRCLDIYRERVCKLELTGFDFDAADTEIDSMKNDLLDVIDNASAVTSYEKLLINTFLVSQSQKIASEQLGIEETKYHRHLKKAIQKVKKIINNE